MKRAGLALLSLALLLTGRVAAETPVIHLITDTSMLDIAYIREGALVTNLNYPNERGIIARYTGVDLEALPTKIQCSARFYGGGAVAIVATPSEEWSIGGITARSVHAVFTGESYHIGFYESGTLTDVLADSYALDTSGETEYTFGIALSGDMITVTLPTGKTVKKRDARAGTCSGTHILFEHYLTAEDAAAGAFPAITQIKATGEGGVVLEDDFARSDGLPRAAPTGQTYVQFRNDSPEP